MVDRNTLECEACGTRIVTRTAIGHGNSQIHSFPCPRCRVGITYRVLLDQRNAGLEYDPNPENAKWIDSEKGAKHEVTFCAELLLPRYALTTPHLTPFIAACGFIRDILTFQRQEAVRLHWRKNIWPVASRLPIHYENENWNLFDADARKIQQKPNKKSTLARLALLRRVYDLPFNWLLYDAGGRRGRIQQRVALARSISPKLIADLARQYLESGRLLELWRQLQEFHNSFVCDFPYLSPLLQAKQYWRESPTDLTPYVVCDKRFPELKLLYIDAFETLARLSVIAIALEAIIHHSSLAIPKKKGSVDLWSFEKLANANKPDHLSKYPIDDLFSPHLDTTLRNGIGHNAARYDAALDEVICIKQSSSKLIEERLNYTVFCDRVIGLSSVVFYSEDYFFSLLEEVGGTLRNDA